MLQPHPSSTSSLDQKHGVGGGALMAITTTKGMVGRSKVQQENLSTQCVLRLGSSPGEPRPGCSLGPGGDQICPLACVLIWVPPAGLPLHPQPRELALGWAPGRDPSSSSGLPFTPGTLQPVPDPRQPHSPRWKAQIRATRCVGSHSHGCPWRKRSALPTHGTGAVRALAGLPQLHGGQNRPGPTGVAGGCREPTKARWGLWCCCCGEPWVWPAQGQRGHSFGAG